MTVSMPLGRGTNFSADVVVCCDGRFFDPVPNVESTPFKNLWRGLKKVGKNLGAFPTIEL